MNSADAPIWLCIERADGVGRDDFAVSNTPGYDEHCFFTGKPKHRPDCGWYRLTNAQSSAPGGSP